MLQQRIAIMIAVLIGAVAGVIITFNHKTDVSYAKALGFCRAISMGADVNVLRQNAAKIGIQTVGPWEENEVQFVPDGGKLHYSGRDACFIVQKDNRVAEIHYSCNDKYFCRDLQ